MSHGDAAGRISGRFDSRFLRGYAAAKLKLDPMYSAVLERVRAGEQPIFDIGCGIGLAAFFLREHGVEVPITGIDFDPRKIDAARAAAAAYAGVEFRTGDARDPIPQGTAVLLLDVLHYFSPEEQTAILRNVAAAATLVIIRDAIRDSSWRYRITVGAERFARAVLWLRAERLNFLTRQSIESAFAGFESEIVPMHGRTPFNNYLMVFRRPSAGMTNA